MQNEQTLIDLGFNKNGYGEYFFRGRNHIFTAKVIDFNGPKTYVELFQVSKETDLRKHSDNYGRKYKTKVADCCSIGSVEKYLNHFDKREKYIND